MQGQLVLLNEKMDLLIETVQNKMTKTGVVGTLLSNQQSVMYLFVLILVALFLGLGDQVMDRVFGSKNSEHSAIMEAIGSPVGPGSPVEMP